MKKNYLLLAGLLLGLLPAARAQYEFLDNSHPGTSSQSASNGLGPCIQNLDDIGAGTFDFLANDGKDVRLPGVMVGYNLGNGYVALTKLLANNGLIGTGSAYNFGTIGDTDRAIGGVADGGNVVGTGYVSIRLKNSTSKTIIKNLDIRYALEQWRNSGIAKDAFFRGSYRVYRTGKTPPQTFAVADLAGAYDADSTKMGNGVWTLLKGLTIQAPATNGVLDAVVGNSTTYRRTAQARLTGINLEPQEEVVIRFDYAFNATTNKNGLAFDDIVIYPETNVLYSQTTGDLTADNMSGAVMWGQSADGSSPPAGKVDFTADNNTFYVRGTGTGNRIASNTTWKVSGANSRIVVGLPNEPATLQIAATDNIQGTLDVSGGSTLNLVQTPANLTLGSLAKGSTVQYLATSGSQSVLPATYSVLKASGAALKVLAGAAIVGKELALTGPVDDVQALQLGSHNLTLLRDAALTISDAQLVTNGTGLLRATVQKGATTALLFPVATTALSTDYTPVWLTPGSTDLDQTYGVRVIDGVYAGYNAKGALGQASSRSGNVTKTWLIDREAADKSTVKATLALGWKTAQQGATFDPAKAYIDHYTVADGTWDNQKPATLGATASNGLWQAQRTGVTNFSPFAVTSQTYGPLPVTLVGFEARRLAQTVVCDWRTAQELNNDHFVVERSLSGTGFEAVGTVAGHGTTSSEQQYRFVDQQAPAGLVYYRLRQVDADGTETYSAIVTIDAGATAAAYLVSVMPNPGTGSYQLVAPATNRSAEVFNVLGSLVQTVAADGRIDLQAQPVGVYLVRLYLPEGPRTIRVIKQ